MKKQIILCALVLFAMAALNVSCKKEDNSSPNTGGSSSPTLTSILTAGSWRIHYYHESNEDHTANFNGYTFVFNGNGTMTATNSSGTTNGTWSIDDSNANEMHMSCGSSAPLSDLNNGWLVISKTTTEIHLKDDDTAHNEEVHFVKI